MISHQTPAPFPLITQPPTPSLPRISRTAFCLNPAKTVSFPHNLTSPDLPGSVWITSPQLSAQAISAQNVSECSVTSARGSRPPSKDPPSAAEPPRGEVSTNQGDIEEAGPSTSRHVAGSIAKGLMMLPRVATTKRMAKGRPESRRWMRSLRNRFKTCLLTNVWYGCRSSVEEGEEGAGVVLKKVKRKTTVLLEERQAFKERQGAAFLAWQEANRIGEGDWEEREMGEVPSNNADFDA
ncbi:hypothetical protein E4T56_gene6602 [Termitomyces sp. T112]|nr:hypothetical protein E4T56_gene6602 [Termitomyces sp. T112]